MTVTITITVNTNNLTFDIPSLAEKTTMQNRSIDIGVLEKVNQARGARPPVFNIPQTPHPPGFPTLVLARGDQVRWVCTQPFFVRIQPNHNEAAKLPIAPDNPFNFAGGVKFGNATTPVVGTVQDDPNVRSQMFYKFSVFVEGKPPIDPDMVCDF